MFTKEKLEGIYHDDESMWWMMLVSLISSDTLLTIEDCDKSLVILHELNDILPTTDIPKEHWEKYVEDGIKICEQTKEELSKAKI